MFKRYFLFVLTNIAVLVMVSIVLAILGQLGILDLAGGQGALLVYCAVWGFGAAFVSLLLSRWMAKRAMGVQLVGPDIAHPEAQWLYATVARLTQQANLPMPEVGIYDSPEVNAFATGPVEEAQPRRRLDRPAAQHGARGDRGCPGPRGRRTSRTATW